MKYSFNTVMAFRSGIKVLRFYILAHLRLNELVAQKPSANVHNILDGSVRNNAVHVQHVAKGGYVARITIHVGRNCTVAPRECSVAPW